MKCVKCTRNAMPNSNYCEEHLPVSTTKVLRNFDELSENWNYGTKSCDESDGYEIEGEGGESNL